MRRNGEAIVERAARIADDVLFPAAVAADRVIGITPYRVWQAPMS